MRCWSMDYWGPHSTLSAPGVPLTYALSGAFIFHLVFLNDLERNEPKHFASPTFNRRSSQFLLQQKVGHESGGLGWWAPCGFG